MNRLANILMQADAAFELADAVETSQRITWQGPVSLSQAITIGAILIVLSGVALWSESRFTGRRAPLFFWPARIIVLALVMWMLLEPTSTTAQRRTERKSLAVIADISGSMDIVDAADAATDLRWDTAFESDADGLLSLGDRLLLAANEARARLRSAEQLAAVPRAGARLQRELEASLRACGRAQALLEQAATAAVPSESSDQVAALLVSVRDDVTPGIQGLLKNAAGESPQARATALRAWAGNMEPVGQLARRLSAAALAGAVATDAQVAIGQSTELHSRHEKVDRLLRLAEGSWLGDAEKESRIQRWTFAADLQPVAVNQWSATTKSQVVSTDPANDPPPLTNLTALLEHIGRSAVNDRLEAVVLFTDGRHNAPDSRDPLEVAGSLGRLPIYVVPVGDDRLLRDVLVHHLEAPRAVAKDDKIVLEALITAIDCAGERVRVELLAKDRFDNEQVVDQREFTPTAARIDETVAFTALRDEVGRYEFRVRAVPIVDEASPDNNHASISVDVVETDMTVLLADEAPRWEFRYLSRLFERDEHIEYDQLLFQPTPAGTGNLAQSLSLPIDASEWGRYRVVVLGDLPPAVLPRAAQDGLRDFVTERGGTLVLIAGAQSMPAAFAGQPLGEMLPVVAGPPSAAGTSYAVALTAEGRMSPAVQVADSPGESERAWQDAFRFTPVPWLSEFRIPKPTAHTLLRAVDVKGRQARDEQDAVLCWQAVGRGRVVYFSAPDSYRLRARHGDRYHHAFWGQFLRWCIAPDLSAGSKTVHVRTDKQRYDAREPVQVTVELRNAAGEPVTAARVQAVAEQYGQDVAQIDLEEDPNAPGQYLGRFDQLPDGASTIRPVGDDVAQLLASESYAGEVTTPIVVSQQLNAEMNDTRSNPALLARLAELTGGHVIPPTAVSEIPQLAALSPDVIETETHQPLWNNWWCLAVISGCLIGEWIVRKRVSLL